MRNTLLRLSAGLLACLLLLSGCGASTNSHSSSSYARSAGQMPQVEEDMMTEVPMETTGTQGATGGSSANVTIPTLPQDDRKRIQRVTLTLESREFEAALEQLTTAVTQAGGYLSDQRVEGRSIHAQDEYYQRTATLNARVPVDRLDEVVQQVGSICNVTNTRTAVDDITDQYVDTETRLEALRLQETRLMELMAQAQNMEDLLVIEERLSEVQYLIESLTGQKQKMDQQVAYSYLSMTLEEVVEYQAVRGQPATFGDRLNSSLQRSGRNVANSLEGLLFFLIESGPLLVIYGGLLLLVVLVIRKASGAWRQKHPLPHRPDGPAPRGITGWGAPPPPVGPDTQTPAPESPTEPDQS